MNLNSQYSTSASCNILITLGKLQIESRDKGPKNENGEWRTFHNEELHNYTIH